MLTQIARRWSFARCACGAASSPLIASIPLMRSPAIGRGLGRRAVLGGICLTGSGATSIAGAATSAGLIDVHHHYIPPFYLDENRDRIAGSRGGALSPAWQGWTPENGLAAMDASGVQTAILSLSTPGVWFGDPVAARITARKCNEYAADLSVKNPGRYGLFAAVPMPDQDATLAEIAYAYDMLKADGIGVLTSYGDKWIGDPMYRPAFEELNRRSSVVFVHPTAPNCCRLLVPGVIPLVSEVPQDTTRAITSLLFSGAFRRYPNIRFIFTHAGGTIPMVGGRLTHYGPDNMKQIVPDGVEYELKRLYYDIAGTTYPSAIAGLTTLIPPSQILFGSDNPYVPVADTATGMMHVGLSAAQLQALGRDNARRLIPRLAS